MIFSQIAKQYENLTEAGLLNFSDDIKYQLNSRVQNTNCTQAEIQSFFNYLSDILYSLDCILKTHNLFIKVYDDQSKPYIIKIIKELINWIINNQSIFDFINGVSHLYFISKQQKIFIRELNILQHKSLNKDYQIALLNRDNLINKINNCPIVIELTKEEMELIKIIDFGITEQLIINSPKDFNKTMQIKNAQLRKKIKNQYFEKLEKELGQNFLFYLINNLFLREHSKGEIIPELSSNNNNHNNAETPKQIRDNINELIKSFDSLIDISPAIDIYDIYYSLNSYCHEYFPGYYAEVFNSKTLPAQLMFLIQKNLFLNVLGHVPGPGPGQVPGKRSNKTFKTEHINKNNNNNNPIIGFSILISLNPEVSNRVIGEILFDLQNSNYEKNTMELFILNQSCQSGCLFEPLHKSDVLIDSIKEDINSTKSFYSIQKKQKKNSICTACIYGNLKPNIDIEILQQLLDLISQAIAIFLSCHSYYTPSINTYETHNIFKLFVKKLILTPGNIQLLAKHSKINFSDLIQGVMLDTIFKIKYLCVNSIFETFINSTSDMLDYLRECLVNNSINEPIHLFKVIYSNYYHQIMNSSESLTLVDFEPIINIKNFEVNNYYSNSYQQLKHLAIALSLLNEYANSFTVKDKKSVITKVFLMTQNRTFQEKVSVSDLAIFLNLMHKKVSIHHSIEKSETSTQKSSVCNSATVDIAKDVLI